MKTRAGRLVSFPGKWIPLVLAALTALIFYPGLSGEWIFDDYPNIVNNWRVQPASLTWQAFLNAAQAYQPGHYGRPLATLWFTFDYLIGGKNPQAFKISNLALHLANTALVFVFLQRLLAFPRVSSEPRPWHPWGIALITLAWAIHPLQVSTVLYIVQRMEMLSLTFVLLGLIAYIKARVAQINGSTGAKWAALSALCAMLGMLAKESAVLFPLYLLVLELTVLRFEASRPSVSRALRAGHLGVCIAITAVFAFHVVPTYVDTGLMPGRNFTVYERVLTQFRVLVMYLGQIIFPAPAHMTFYYDSYPPSSGWLQPWTTIVSAGFLTSLLALGWRIRSSMPLVSCGIGLFFAGHALTSNVINLELAYEHRNYFALLGVVLVFADGLRRLPTPNRSGSKAVIALAAISGLAFLTVLRSATWGDPMLLAMEHRHKNPGSIRASSDIGTLYYGISGANANDPYFSLAIAEFERGMALPGASPLPEQALILMAASANVPPDPGWWTSLINKLETRPIGVQEIAALNGLVQGRFQGAEIDDQLLRIAYDTLLSRGPLTRETYSQYGDYAYVFLSDPDLSMSMYRKSIAASQYDWRYISLISSGLRRNGREEHAREIESWAKLTAGAEDSEASDPPNPGNTSATQPW